MPLKRPEESAASSTAAVGSVAFFPVSELHIPHNNREYYLSKEMERRGWGVHWLRPDTGTNDGVRVEWPVIRFRDLQLRGQTYYLPIYLAAKLRLNGVRTLWLSGWNLRPPREVRWMVQVMKCAGVRVVYDPIDPICEFNAARAGAEPKPGCLEEMQAVYSMCDLVLCVTPELRDLLVSHGAPEDRLSVARWGTDARLFDPDTTPRNLKRRLDVAQETFLVGWLGTMERLKGLEEILLPVVERLAREKSDVHFVIAGRGPLAQKVRAWAEGSPDLPVSVLPSIPYEEAPSFTASLDTYLVPTNPRTAYARSICPVKCLDALAMGTPQIVTRTEATAFLEAYPTVSLVEFDRDAVYEALIDRYDQWCTGT